MTASAVTDIYTVILEVDASSGAAVLQQTDTALGSTAASAEKLAQRFKDLTVTMEGSSAADRTKLRTVESVDAAITRLVNQSLTPYEKSLRAVERAEEVAARARKLGSDQADAAAAAVDRLRQRTEALAKAANDNATATAAMATRMEELRAKFDPAYAAAQRLNSELEDLAEAERLGVEVAGGYAAALDRLTEKHDASAAAARKNATAQAEMIAAAKAAQAATNAQSQFNSLLGVDRASSGSAAASARVFEEANAALETRAKILNDLRLAEKTRDADRWQAMLDEEARSAAAAAAEELRLAAATQAVRDKINPLLPLERARNDEIARATQLANQFRIGEAEKAAAIAAANKAYEDGVQKLKATGQIATEAGGKVQLAAHQWTNLSYQIQDVAVQLGSGTNPFVVMLQQGPQATGAVGGVANALRLLATPWTAAAAAAAVFVIPLAAGVARAIELSSQTRTLSVAIQAMGASARATAGDLGVMVEALRKQGVAQADAIAVARASLDPRLTQGVGNQLAALVPNFAAGTGLDAAAAMNKLTTAARGGVDAISALAVEYGTLDGEQLKAIRDMARAGDTAQALQVYIAALTRQFADLHEKSLTPTAKAMQEASNAWRGMTTAIAESWPVVKLLEGVAGAVNNVTKALQGDWSKLFWLLEKLTVGPGSTVFGALSKGASIADFAGDVADAAKESVIGRRPPIPRPRPSFANDNTSGTSNPGGQPDVPAPTVEQIDATNKYVEARRREQAVLRASLPDRAAVRAAQEAEQVIAERGLIGKQAEIVRTEALRTALLAETDSIRQQTAELARSTAAALAQADAWQKGDAAAASAAARAQAIEINETKARINVEAWTQAILDNNAAQTAADLAKGNSAMSERVVYLMKAAEAEAKGAEAVADLELAEKQRLATQKAIADLANATDPKVRERLEWEIKNTKSLIAEVDRGERERAAAQALRARQQDLLLAQGERDIALETDPTKRAAMELALQHKRDEYEIRQRIGNLGEEAVQKELALADAVARTRQETARISEIQAKGKELFDDLANMVEQAGQRGGKGFFASFVDWGRAAIKTLAKEMLFRPIIQPILTSLVGAVPQLFGIAGGPNAAGGAASGGLSSIMSPITDAIGLAKTFIGDAFTGVTSAINSFGTSLGFGSGIAAAAPSASFIGPMPLASGALGTTTTLSGLLGGVGAGFGVGNLLNSLFGGSQVGGMVGSGVGSLGGALAGTFLFPGVGTLLGGLLGGGAGGIIGGLFGKDEKKPLGNARLGEVVGNRLTYGGDTSLDGYDNSREMAQMRQAVDLVNGIVDKLGLTIDQSLLARGFGDASNSVGLIGKTSTFDGPADLSAWIQRFFGGREGQSYLKGGSGTVQTLLDQMASGNSTFKPKDGDAVLKAIDYAAGFDDTVKRAGAGINTLARQLLEFDIAARESGKNLAKTVRDYIDQAREYFGDNSTQVNQAATAQRQNIFASIGLDPNGNVAPTTSDMLTGRDAELAQAKKQIDAVKDALLATGLTAEQATAYIDKANAAQAAAINKRWDETDRRTAFSFAQRDTAAQMALGIGGVDAQAMARDAQMEQHRQELYDAEAAGMKKADLERLKYIQGLEEEALKQQQIEQTRRASESLTDRNNAALVSVGRMTGNQAQTEALQARHRQELWDAEHSGMSQMMLDQLKHTQQLEDEALAYQQAVAAVDRAATLDQRKYKAQLTLHDPRVDQNWIEQNDLNVQHWREMNQAISEGWSDNQIKQLQQVQALEQQALALQQAERALQKEEGLVGRTAQALSGMLAGSSAQQAGQRLAEDIDRQIKQAQELRAATSDADRARIREIQTIEDTAVAAQRAAQDQQQYNQALKAAKDQIDGFRKSVDAWVNQQKLTQPGGANIADGFAEAQRQYNEQLAKVKAGDTDAMQTLTGFADRYIQAAQAMYSSGGTANLDAAKQVYDALVDRARQGDAEALAQVQQAADQYKQIALNTYASGDAYQQIRQSIVDGLKGLPEQLDPELMATKAIDKLNEDLVPLTQEQLDVIRSLERLSMATKTAIGLANGTLDNTKLAVTVLQQSQLDEAKEGNRIAREIRDKIGTSAATPPPAPPPPPPPATGPTPEQAYSNLVALAGTVQQTDASWRASGKTDAEVAQLIEAQYGGYRDSLLSQMTPALINQFGQMFWNGVGGPGPEYARSLIRQAGGVPAFAGGGWHDGGWAVVGERGPELAWFNRGAQIYPNDRSAKMLGDFAMPAMPRGAANDRELVAEVKALRQEVAAMRRERAQQAALHIDATKRGADKMADAITAEGAQQRAAMRANSAVGKARSTA